MVKNSGVHGLAQQLTEVRRWQTLTPEEAPLAYELFLLVAKLCVQTRQRARARQYLTSALQLDATPEVEALLAEVSDQSLSAGKVTPTAGAVAPSPVKTPVATPHPSGPIRLKYPAVPHPPVVLPEGARSGRPRIGSILTSGVSAIAVLIVVAVLVIWSMPDDPPLASLPLPRERRAVLPNADLVSPAPQQEVASLNQKPTFPQQQASAVFPPPPAVSTLASGGISISLETKKIDTPPSAPKTQAQAIVSANTSNQEATPRANVTQPAPARPAAETVAQARVPAPPPPAKEASKNVQPVSESKPAVKPRPAVTQPVPAKLATDNVTSKRIVAPPPSPPPSVPVPKVVEKPASPAPVTVTKEIATSVPPGSLNIHSSPSFYAPMKPESMPRKPFQPPVAGVEDSSRTGSSATVVAVQQPRSPEPAAVEKANPQTPTGSQPPLAEAPSQEKRDTLSEKPSFSSAALPDTKPDEAPEGRPTEQATVAESESETPHPATIDVEPREAPVTSPTRKEDEPRTGVSVAGVGGQSTPASEEQRTPEVADVRSGEDERTAAVAKDTSEPGPGDSARIARLSSRVPHASRFPVRERLVSVPPERLMTEMPALMRQEIGDSTVRKISPGVIRARLSGKPRNPARPPKEYGQYLVEIVPGPTEGTSRVRTRVLLFNWRTGDPITDADERADQLLMKITAE